MSSRHHALPTQPVLLPGQQLSTRVPWERDDNPPPAFVRHALPSRGNALDARGLLDADVVSGLNIGSCQVIRKLTPGSVHNLLALRDTPGDGLVPVVMRLVDVSDVFHADVRAYADEAAELEHPHLARVFPCEVSDEGLFWVTALVSGATLAEISDACVKAGKAVPVGIALAAVHEAALALAQLHAPPGEAHGLLCDRSLVVGFDGSARVLDVGLFRALQHQGLWPEVLDRVGPYLAPEQVLRGHLPDPRSDVFSLAALLHAFLSGGRTPAQLSFDQRAETHRKGGYPPPSSLNISLSNKVDEVVMKALSPDPMHRYPNAVDFAHALKFAASELFWRRELRAQFVGQLFAERKRREEVLFAATSSDSKENAMARSAHQRSRTPPWARAAPAPPPLPPVKVKTSLKKRQYQLASPTPDLVTRPEGLASFDVNDIPFEDDVPFAESGVMEVMAGDELFEEEQEDDGEAYDAEGNPRTRLRPLVLTLIAVALTWFWQQGVLLDEVPQAAAKQAAKFERVARPHLFPVYFWSPAPFFPQRTEPVVQLLSDEAVVEFSPPAPVEAVPASEPMKTVEAAPVVPTTVAAAAPKAPPVKLKKKARRTRR